MYDTQHLNFTVCWNFWVELLNSGQPDSYCHCWICLSIEVFFCTRLWLYTGVWNHDQPPYPSVPISSSHILYSTCVINIVHIHALRFYLQYVLLIMYDIINHAIGYYHIIVYIVWLAMNWFGFCYTWRTIAPPTQLTHHLHHCFSMFWGHRNSALFCSRVWPSMTPTNIDLKQTHEEEIHQTFRSRCFFVDVWLVHVWVCFCFSRSDLCLTAKKRGRRSCVVLPLQGFDCGAMTVLSHGTWSSTDGNV